MDVPRDWEGNVPEDARFFMHNISVYDDDYSYFTTSLNITYTNATECMGGRLLLTKIARNVFEFRD